MRRWGELLCLWLMVWTRGTALAEGSAEFDIGDTGANTPHDQAAFDGTALRVDILNAGDEKVCWKGTGALEVYRPDAVTLVGTVANQNCVVAAPFVTGAYSLRMLSAQLIGTEWDVRVCASSVSDADCLSIDANEQTGRLWSTRWDFRANTSFSNSFSINGSVYAVVPGGGVGKDAVIEMQMRGVSGAVYKLSANGIGPETSAGVRVGRSVPTSGYKVTPEYRLYLNPPASAVYNWIAPLINDVRVTSSCSGGVVLDAAPGSITFTSNITGKYMLLCDANRDSVFDFADSRDFSTVGEAALGANSVLWNGKSNAGVAVAAGSYQCVIRLNVGEFHYIAEDIETAYPGLRMYRLEADKSTRTPIVMFWDDNATTLDAELMNNVAGQLSPNSAGGTGLYPGSYLDLTSPFYLNGAVPTGNARAWGNFDSDGKGNNHFLDQFTAADTVVSPEFSIGVIISSDDADSDGLLNARECTLGSNPEQADTDGDGVDDGFEATATTARTTDTDGILDVLDTDDDGDGILTRTELGGENGDGDPSDAANTDGAADGPDYLDVDADNDSVPDTTDLARTNPNVCRDQDGDACDDCTRTGPTGSASTANDGVDTNADGICDLGDDDDDGDGVLDAGDVAPIDHTRCRDFEGDGCDDCTIVHTGAGDVANDGLDTDGDRICDVTDPDLDNDGALNAGDSAPLNALICHDLDVDLCDDCALTGANGSDGNKLNDGPDFDGDGLCNLGDPDDDNDGALDADDSNDRDRNVCSDVDADTCEDCEGGAFGPSSDGPDTDGDGLCNAGDPDDDGDGALDAVDSDDFDRNVCSDQDGDACNDCEGGQFDLASDGPDTDLDGLCDSGDPDDDGDTVPDVDDTNDRNGKVCFDRDRDGCDDCVTGRPDAAADGRDTDGDGLCDVGDDTDGDGVVDVQDADDDNDGVPDALENIASLDPDADGDGDGVVNYLDADDRGDGMANACADADANGRCETLAVWWDEDEDGVANHLDLDADNDGILDVLEAGFLRQDLDGDGLVDGPYGDNGLADALETAPESGKLAQAALDTDADGVLDALDLDSDGDGAFDLTEVGALAELDADGDGRVDSRSDDDGDGLMDPLDEDDERFGFPTQAADPRASDADGDDIPNAFDFDDESRGPGDSDGDGLEDDAECAGGWPCPDTDRDGTPDYASSDGDQDGVPGVVDPDDDNDGILDVDEDLIGVDPGADHDGDGVQNFRDASDRGDGKAQDCADESPSDEICDELPELFDFDRDGIPNHLDLDSDGDTIRDADETGRAVRDTDDDGGPDFLDLDADGDGQSDASEAGDDDLRTKPRDTDRDGRADAHDDDDDDDGILTVEERAPEQDSDDDGKPDFLDADDDDDGTATRDEPGDADDNGVLDRLEPPERPHFKGGAACSVERSGQQHGVRFVALLLLCLGWLLRRRKGVVRAQTRLCFLLMVYALGLVRPAQAQVALDMFRPAPLASDGFALSRPEVLREHEWGALAVLDYARNPLVVELPRADREVQVVHDHLVLHVGAAFAVERRLTVFTTLPIHTLMRGDDPGVYGKPADGAGIGDLTLGLRLWILGGPSASGTLSLELIARAPTAELVRAKQVYSGDEVGSYEPALLGELRRGRFDARLRGGMRFRRKIQIGDLTIGQELVVGLGARYRLVQGLYAHAELVGLSTFSNFADPEHTPLELLLGAKYSLADWLLGAAVGPGLVRGYGAPDARAVLMLGYAPVEKPKPLPPPPPADRDFDGLLDDQDRCPLAPEDEDNFRDSDGCPDTDNDQDGVLDINDRCLLEPEDRDGFEDQNGCAEPDNDQDGILDVVDKCPLVPGVPEAQGCREERPKLAIENGKLAILGRVEFATSKDVILEKSEPILLEVRDTLLSNPDILRLRIEGHTDSAGVDAKNLDLSVRRANSVAKWVAEHGIAPDRLEAWGCGEIVPAASNATPEGRQENRRVEFHVVDPAPVLVRNVPGCVQKKPAK